MDTEGRGAGGRRPEEGERPLFRLVVTRPEGATEVVDLTRRPLTVGRAEGVDVHVDEARVSRHHCVIFGGPGRLVVRDLGSSNGTLVNGAPVQQATLAHGDVIEVGATRLTVELVGGREPAAPVSFLSSPTTVAAAPAARPAPTWPPTDGRVTARLVRLLGSTAEPEAAASASLDLLLEALPFDRACVLVPGGSEGELRVLASKSREGRSSTLFEPSRAVAERVARSLTPYYGVDAAAGSSAGSSGELDISAMRVLFCAPFEMEGAGVGALYAETRAGESDVDERAIPVFTALADQARRVVSTALAVAGARGERGRLEETVRTLEGELARRTAEETNLRLELALRSAELGEVRDAHRELAQGLVAEAGALAGTLEAKLARLVGRGGAALPQTAESAAADVRAFKVLAECMATALEIEDGDLRLSMAAQPVSDILRPAIARREADARAYGVTLKVSPMPHAVTTMVDGVVMGRVLDVLLGAAIRFAGPGGHVELSATETRGRLEILLAERGAASGEQARLEALEAWTAADQGSPFLLGVCDRFCRRASEVQGAQLLLRGDEAGLEWRLSLPARGPGASGDATRLGG